MARRKAERPAERGPRRAETNAVAAYLTALKGLRPSGSSKARREGLLQRRAQIKQWLSEESSPIREVGLIQQRLDIDAQLAQIDQAARLPEPEEAFVNVAASWAKRSGISAAALREVGVPASVCSSALASSESDDVGKDHVDVGAMVQDMVTTLQPRYEGGPMPDDEVVDKRMRSKCEMNNMPDRLCAAVMGSY